MVVLTSAEHKVGFTADNLTKGFASGLGFGTGDNLLSGADPVGLRGKITVKGTAGDVTIDLNRSIDSLVQKLNAVAGVSASFQDGRLNITGTSGPLEIKAGADSTGTDSEGKNRLKRCLVQKIFLWCKRLVPFSPMQCHQGPILDPFRLLHRMAHCRSLICPVRTRIRRL